MSEWHDLKKEKPDIVCNFVNGNAEIYKKTSEQLLLYINEKIYVGYFAYEKLEEETEPGKYNTTWNYCIELATYTDTDLGNHYELELQSDCIFEEDFNKYDIYWKKIDTLGIILSIDLLKKEANNG